MFEENYCIVGNAPSEVGTKGGGFIDSCDQVIRFNNYSTSVEYQDDYGSKTTHWVTTFAKDIRPRIHQCEVVCPLPLDVPKYLTRYSYTNLRALRVHMDTTTFIPQEYFEELLESVPNPSTGIALLFWLWKDMGSLDPERVKGFTFFDKSIKHHYFDEFNQCHHKGDIEKELYQKMVLTDDM